MTAKHFSSLDDPELTRMLMQGAVGILPTDTVYGLVAPALHRESVERLYSLKQRKRQPGTTIAASVEQLHEAGFSLEELARAAHYWPNAISVEMTTFSIPDYLKKGQTHMAARIPKDAAIIQLLEQVGPLMTSSANTPKAPTSRTIGEAVNYFGDEVDFYVDAGDLGERPPSTIIGFGEKGETIVYRHGAVDIETR